jgi:para-nitrobenzyl esterase
MKSIRRLFLMALFYPAFLSAQIAECDNGMYLTEQFSSFTVQSNIQYGQAINSEGVNIDLLMDIYLPDADNRTQRPVLILAHGGSFIGGSKTADNSIVELCGRFAKLGYVTVSMNYRLENPLTIFLSPNVALTFIEAVYRAVQDQKAAIRYLRKSVAQMGNPYGIDPNRVVVGGNSAGAILSLHNAYLDKTSEVPPGVSPNLGDLEGNSGNPGFPSGVQAVVNICGALADSVWLEPGNQPFVSLHGDQDGTVPHNTAIANPGIPVMEVDGSLTLHQRAQNIGVRNDFYLWLGAGHSPQNSNSAYMDSTFWFVRDFLWDLVCNDQLSLAAHSEPASVVYPNPISSTANSSLHFNSLWTGTVRLLDESGREVLFRELSSDTQLKELPELAPGIYSLLWTKPNGKVEVHKIAVRQ